MAAPLPFCYKGPEALRHCLTAVLPFSYIEQRPILRVTASSRPEFSETRLVLRKFATAAEFAAGYMSVLVNKLRFSDMKTLREIDTDIADGIHQARCFDKFGNGTLAHGFDDVIDRLDHGEVSWIIKDILDQ